MSGGPAGTRTPAGGTVIGQLQHVTPRKWRERQKGGITVTICLSCKCSTILRIISIIVANRTYLYLFVANRGCFHQHSARYATNGYEWLWMATIDDDWRRFTTIGDEWIQMTTNHNNSLPWLTTNDADFTRNRYKWLQMATNDDDWWRLMTIDDDWRRLTTIDNDNSLLIFVIHRQS